MFYCQDTIHHMIQLSEIHTGHEHYPFVEGLLHSAFPQKERRDTSQQREYTDHQPKFHCLLVTDDKRPIGLITHWNFDEFTYIEHFAIDAKLRGKGYGNAALKLMLEQTDRPVVLEVEIPYNTQDIAYHRINFYKRQGFQVRKTDYKQPPYRPGDEWLPMKLMTRGKFKKIAPIRETIHREVYGVKP